MPLLPPLLHPSRPMFSQNSLNNLLYYFKICSLYVQFNFPFNACCWIMAWIPFHGNVSDLASQPLSVTCLQPTAPTAGLAGGNSQSLPGVWVADSTSAARETHSWLGCKDEIVSSLLQTGWPEKEVFHHLWYCWEVELLWMLSSSPLVCSYKSAYKHTVSVVE